jgi:hypothetical protein
VWEKRKYACKAQRIVNRVSLNSIVVRVQGVMTVDVTTVPGTITDITFDKGNNSPETWTVTGATPVEQSATITGRFLTGAIPSVTSIEAPEGHSQKIADYIDPKSVSVVTDQSNDTKVVFKLQLKTTVPPGSKLHFIVTKVDSKDTKKSVNSMDFMLSVNYLRISSITIDKEDAATTWASGFTVSGNIVGSGLKDAKPPEVKDISVPTDKSAKPGRYIDATRVDSTKTNEDSNLYFTLHLIEAVPTGSKITFSISKDIAAGAGKIETVTSNSEDYSVKHK